MTAPRRIAALALSLVALLAFVLAWREAQRTHAAATAAGAAARQRDELRHRFLEAQQRLALVEGAAAAIPMAAPVPAESAAAPAPPHGVQVTTTMTVGPVSVDPQILAATDPELRAMHLQAFEAELDGKWGPLFKQLNLSREMIERFKTLQRAHEARRLDVTAVAGEHHLALSDPAIQKMRSEDGTRRAQEMLALLGAEDAKIYRQYNRDLELQPLVTEVAGRTYFTDAPLTFDQSQRLLAILSATSEHRPNGFVNPGSVKWADALAQIEASGAFTPAVVTAFRRLAAERSIDRKVSERMDEIGTKHAGQSVQTDIWLPGVPALEPIR